MNIIGIIIGIILGSFVFKITHNNENTSFSDGMIISSIITLIVYLI